MSTAERILELWSSEDSLGQGLELLRALDSTDVYNQIAGDVRFVPHSRTGGGDGLGYALQPALTHPALPRRRGCDHPGLLLAVARAGSDAAAAIRAQIEAVSLAGEHAWLLPLLVPALPALEVAGLWEAELHPEALAHPALAGLKRLHVNVQGDPAPMLEALAGTPAPLVSLDLDEVSDLSALRGLSRIFLEVDQLPRGLAALADAPVERLTVQSHAQPLALHTLPHLRRLTIGGGHVQLSALPSRLEQLRCSKGRLSGFEHLAGFSSLRQVEITSAIDPLPAPLVSYLPPGLRALTIRCPEEAPQVLSAPLDLARLAALRSLKVSGAIDLSALGHSAPPELRALWPSASGSLASLAGLRGAPRLEWLSVSRCSSLASLDGLEDHADLFGVYAGHCGALRDLSALQRCPELALVVIEQCRASTPERFADKHLQTFGALWEQMRRRGWGARVQGYDAPD